MTIYKRVTQTIQFAGCITWHVCCTATGVLGVAVLASPVLLRRRIKGEGDRTVLGATTTVLDALEFTQASAAEWFVRLAGNDNNGSDTMCVARPDDISDDEYTALMYDFNAPLQPHEVH